ncbi:uncharacterized protein LOC119651318 isoform X2 [Hermetia illucens]|uniref:uncharacterized protein LOC119651318 isoform X2 n=1 Tax=Hermetia illucens TaxID=343691 RepID=UPI0018CC6406|nr:uncharacterized protein LOC119651318 isoform X2 [Hermetia illucens]
MKLKVLSSFLILLSFYIIYGAKLPDKISTTSVQPAAKRPPTKPTKPQLDVNALAQQMTSTAVIQTTTTYTPTKRPTGKAPPKKYIPSTQKPSTNGPLKISLSKTGSSPARRNNKNDQLGDLICPAENETAFELFAPPCRVHGDCTSWNRNERCCKLFGTKTCVKGVPKPIVEQSHVPLLGLIPRKCPERPLAELWWELKTCETDDDCWPRICCPDGRRQYCRTASPEYESVPPPIGRSIAYLSEYLECTPPPPPVFDLHPKDCNSTLDCFPNICCQESGRKFCRPPKKSVLTVMANFLNIGLVKRLTRNLVIK